MNGILIILLWNAKYNLRFCAVAKWSMGRRKIQFKKMWESFNYNLHNKIIK